MSAWNLRTLVDYTNNGASACINGKWVPARSINYQVRRFRERLKDAWQVFSGKADSFIWPEGQ